MIKDAAHSQLSVLVLMQKKQQVISGASVEKTAAASEELILAEGRRNEMAIFEKYETALAKLIGHQVAAEARQRALGSIRQDTTIDKLGVR